ncbi:hypothetical protein HHX47_DHR1002084 [Lentinula edodes]|nr:hypothetical protein HHX47_DHR1002084 [Lentinula edodes]
MFVQSIFPLSLVCIFLMFQIRSIVGAPIPDCPAVLNDLEDEHQAKSKRSGCTPGI